MHPDSVLIVRDRTSGSVGYLLPQHAAEHFRDLFYYAQALEAERDTLAQVAAVQEERARTQDARIRLLEEINRDLSAKHTAYMHDLEALERMLDRTNRARRGERRRTQIWRTTSLVLAGSTAALGLFVIFR